MRIATFRYRLFLRNRSSVLLCVSVNARPDRPGAQLHEQVHGGSEGDVAMTAVAGPDRGEPVEIMIPAGGDEFVMLRCQVFLQEWTGVFEAGCLHRGEEQRYDDASAGTERADQ